MSTLVEEKATIVLSPVTDETPNLTKTESREELFDPKVKHLYNVNGGNSTPAFSVISIVQDFVRNMESVRNITIPVCLKNISRQNGTGISNRVPSLWETRDVSHKDRPWSVIVGTALGRRPSSSSVLNTRVDLTDRTVDNPKPYTGRRALVTLSEGSLITMGMSLHNVTHILTYEVTSFHHWSECSRPAPSGNEFVALANLKLISIINASSFDKDTCWEDTVSVSPARRDGIDRMRRVLFQNLANPVWTLPFFEHFKTAPASSARGANAQRFSVDADEDCAFSNVSVPEEFMNELSHRINPYQRFLYDANHEVVAKFIPASVHYSVVSSSDTEDLADGILICVEIPSFDREKYQSFAVETRFFDSIPKCLQDEKVIINSARSFGRLLDMVKKGDTTKNVIIRM